jgi:hypothetical protein
LPASEPTSNHALLVHPASNNRPCSLPQVKVLTANARIAESQFSIPTRPTKGSCQRFAARLLQPSGTIISQLSNDNLVEVAQRASQRASLGKMLVQTLQGFSLPLGRGFCEQYLVTKL